MKRNRLPIVFTTVLIAVIAIVAVNLSLGGTRAQEGQIPGDAPVAPPTPTIGAAPERPALEGAAAPKSAAVLFSDSFDGEKAAGAWAFTTLADAIPEDQAAWGVAEGRLGQDGTLVPGGANINETVAYVGDPAWSDYTVSAKVYDQANGTFGLVARRSGDSYYRYSIIANYYPDEPKQLLEKVVNGVSTPLAVVEREGFEPFRWYNVTMSVEGSQIRVWLDGKLVAQATDSELTSGQAGLYTRALGDIYFDDVVVAKP